MRCRTCDYPLWNLRARQCPECGAAFRLSEFEFASGSVNFLCPYCAQPHRGNDELGRIEPADFDCTGCGVRIHFDQMLVAPVGGAMENAPAMPWLERQTRGRLRAFLETIGAALIRPGRLMRSVPISASVGEALTFGTLIMLIVTVVGILIPILLMSGAFRGMAVFGLIYLWYFVPQALLAMMAMLLIWPLMAHLVLRWTGGCQHSIDRTFQVFGYGAGANIFSAVPCAGPYVGWLWWMVSSILMLKQAQRVSGWRATLAVLSLPFSIGIIAMLLVLVVAQWMSGMGGMMGAAGPPGGWGGPGHQTWLLTTQIQQALWTGNQNMPSHAIEMVVGNSTLTAQWGMGATGAAQPFCQPGTKTTPKDIPVGDITLADFLAAGQSAQFKYAARALEQLPPNAPAHRFGDFIFTMPPSASGADPNLWVVVMLPDPDVNGVPQPGDQIYIGEGDGTVTAITYGQLPGLLAQQNQYRQANGFPILPDLITVTHRGVPGDESQAEPPSTEED